MLFRRFTSNCDGIAINHSPRRRLYFLLALFIRRTTRQASTNIYDLPWISPPKPSCSQLCLSASQKVFDLSVSYSSRPCGHFTGNKFNSKILSWQMSWLNTLLSPAPTRLQGGFLTTLWVDQIWSRHNNEKKKCRELQSERTFGGRLGDTGVTSRNL